MFLISTAVSVVSLDLRVLWWTDWNVYESYGVHIICFTDREKNVGSSSSIPPSRPTTRYSSHPIEHRSSGRVVLLLLSSYELFISSPFGNFCPSFLPSSPLLSVSDIRPCKLNTSLVSCMTDLRKRVLSLPTTSTASLRFVFLRSPWSGRRCVPGLCSSP